MLDRHRQMKVRLIPARYLKINLTEGLWRELKEAGSGLSEAKPGHIAGEPPATYCKPFFESKPFVQQAFMLNNVLLMNQLVSTKAPKISPDPKTA